jgi:hypothetical protein
MNMSMGALQFAGFASAPLVPPDDVVPELPKPPLDDVPLVPLEPLVPLLDPKSLSPASEPHATTTPIPPTNASAASTRVRRLMFSD